MTYSELKTQIANYLHRTDLGAQIPTFITLAEATLFRELRVKELQVSATGTTVGGYATLPADFGTVSKVTVSSGGTERSLDYMAQPDSFTASSPVAYALESGKLRIWGAGDAQAYTLYYVPALQNLSDTVTTNWLLDNAPELYLYAASLEASRYIRDDAEVQRLTAQVQASMDSVKRFTERMGQPYTGSMQIKVRSARG